MKNLLLFLSLIFLLGVSSCSEESLDASSEFEALVKKASFTVNVTHQIWSDEAPTQSCLWADGLSYIYFVEDAVVAISKSDQAGIDDSGFNTMTLQTNRSGSIDVSDLEPGDYNIIVNTGFAEQTKVVRAYENVHSLVNFRF